MHNIIKRHEHFLMPEDTPVAKCMYFMIRMRPARLPDDPQYGITVTKRTFKRAVDRNRTKRLVRDWLRFNQNMLRNDCDYVFIIRRACLGARRDDGRTAMRKALHYLRKADVNSSQVA